MSQAYAQMYKEFEEAGFGRGQLLEACEAYERGDVRLSKQASAEYEEFFKGMKSLFLGDAA